MNGLHPFRLTDGVDMDAMRFDQEALGSQQNTEHVGTQMLIQRFSRLPLFEKVKKIFIFHITKEGVTQAARLLFPWTQPSKEASAPVLSAFPEAHSWQF
jgi:hypothetical protein